jgi:hypothetical protein
VGEKLKGYVEHHNQAVAVLSVATLVRHGEWTKEAAITFGKEHSWTEEEIRGMVLLARTSLQEAFDVLDDPLWHEKDTNLSLLDPIDGKLQEVPRKWTPTGIAHKERDSILVVLAEYVKNRQVSERLEKYAKHPNRTVAVHAAGALVRGGEWTKESGINLARQQDWTPSEVQEMIRLGKTAGER